MFIGFTIISNMAVMFARWLKNNFKLTKGQIIMDKFYKFLHYFERSLSLNGSTWIKSLFDSNTNRLFSIKSLSKNFLTPIFKKLLRQSLFLKSLFNLTISWLKISKLGHKLKISKLGHKLNSLDNNLSKKLDLYNESIKLLKLLKLPSNVVLR